jgi:ferredoxin
VRVAAERRADGVYIAAGVELIEPETRHQSTRGDWVEPSRVARLGDKLGWQTAKRLRKATGHRSFSYTRTPVLKACACSAVFVGDSCDSCTRHCPACKREADLLSTRTAVRRFRAKQQRQPLVLQCRQCDAPMTAKRSTKAFCSEKCRVAAHRENRDCALAPC